MINFTSILNQKRKIFLIFGVFFLLESISFLSYYFSFINLSAFLLIALLTLILSIYKLEWGFYLLISELFFNSMGYIFYIENGGFKISLRIILWLIILSVWLAKFLLIFFKKDKKILLEYSKINYAKSFFYLALFIILGLIFGIIKNNFSDAFFDFNAWLYFALIFPLWHINLSFDDNKIKRNNFWQNIINIFISAVLFLIFKSLLFLFLFSHNIKVIIADLYYWTRIYGLGEITNMGSGFYRVFLQSQIFILLAFIIFSSFLFFIKNKKQKFYLFLFLSFLSSVLILSFSRSFWAGMIVALGLLFLFLWIRFGFKKILTPFFLCLSSFIVGFLLVFSIVKFPWPVSTVEFNLESLSDRANVKSNESAISSRWALLDVMKGDIRSNFLLGRGFGARIEYKSSDPRVLERTADGVYSTYAFEWGWFDIWLKLGLFGLITYILLLFYLLKNFWQSFLNDNNFIYLSLGFSVIALIVVNFFTPYLNHPLGIGFIVILCLLPICLE